MSSRFIAVLRGLSTMHRTRRHGRTMCANARLVHPLEALADDAPLAGLTVDGAGQRPAGADLLDTDVALQLPGQFLGPALGGALALEQLIAIVDHGGVKHGGGKNGHDRLPKKVSRYCATAAPITPSPRRKPGAMERLRWRSSCVPWVPAFAGTTLLIASTGLEEVAGDGVGFAAAFHLMQRVVELFDEVRLIGVAPVVSIGVAEEAMFHGDLRRFFKWRVAASFVVFAFGLELVQRPLNGNAVVDIAIDAPQPKLDDIGLAVPAFLHAQQAGAHRLVEGSAADDEAGVVADGETVEILRPALARLRRQHVLAAHGHHLFFIQRQRVGPGPRLVLGVHVRRVQREAGA
ncbi:conserved hypothetical protein, partial [Ricinus communis]